MVKVRRVVGTIRPEHILAGHTREVQTLVEQLRRLIPQTVPNAREKTNPGWHSIGYYNSESGYFCGIFPQGDSVKLGFENGALLADPKGLLEGSDKRVRYVVSSEVQKISAWSLAKSCYWQRLERRTSEEEGMNIYQQCAFDAVEHAGLQIFAPYKDEGIDAVLVKGEGIFSDGVIRYRNSVFGEAAHA